MRRVVLAALLGGLAASAPAGAVSLPERTLLVSSGQDGGAAAGASTRPSVSPGGTQVAFDSVATDLVEEDRNGAVRDVFLSDVRDGLVRLVSTAPDGAPADGPSDSAVLSGKSGLLAFASRATNLVPGDRNGAGDIFVRAGEASVRRISVAPGGREADGPSTQPDISRSGAVVVFTSTAANLVAGDTNGRSDVFAADLVTGQVRRVSQPDSGGEPDGRSLNPAVSPDGRWVVFASQATNLVPRDRNAVGDVFLADLRSGRVRRVSVSSREREQSKAVAAPFTQVADVSANGRRVVFDSDAANLVPRDRNRDTDVFVRDVRAGTTRRASVATTDREATNDSFNPSLTPSGRFVAFESFAERMAAGDARGEDVFVRDLSLRTTSVVNVTSRGARPRGREAVRQLLQRPALSDDAGIVAFTSTAGNLVAGDENRVEDVLLRLMSAPRGGFAQAPPARTRRRQPRFRLRADDRAATAFLCSVDGRRRVCGLRSRLPALRPGRHTLSVRAGGPGMLFSPRTSTRRFRVLR